MSFAAIISSGLKYTKSSSGVDVTIDITNPASDGAVTGPDLLATFSDIEITNLNITYPIEGQETTTDIKITFNG